MNTKTQTQTADASQNLAPENRQTLSEAFAEWERLRDDSTKLHIAYIDSVKARKIAWDKYVDIRG